MSGAPKTFFSPGFNNRFGKGESRFNLCIHYIYSFFQKEVAVPRFRWEAPFVHLKRHHALLFQGGQKEQRGELA